MCHFFSSIALFLAMDIQTYDYSLPNVYTEGLLVYFNAK